MPRKPRPELVDDENPEWTAADFARARPAAEVLREQFGAGAEHLLRPKRGRPPKAERKSPVNIRLSPEVLAHFRATGRGWQTRLEAVLKEHVAKERRKPARARRRARSRQART